MELTPGAHDTGLDDLARRIRDLELRVVSLEWRLESQDLPSAPDAELATAGAAEAILPGTGQLATLLGKSLLGLAGAYTLRALTEMGAIPVPAGVAVGLLYAAAWLFMAARTGEHERPVTAIRGVTASLILLPLLWESHVRFGALSSAATAALLFAFAVLGLAVAWRRNLTAIAWITSMSSLLATCALLVVTKDLIPFTLTLLGLAVAVEVSACLNHWLTERWVVAIAVNLAALLMVFIAAAPSGFPEAYVPFSRQAALAVLAALLTVYLASTIARTLWRGFAMTRFEIAQCVVAFAIATGGALRVSQGHPGAVLTVGLLSALGALLCYGVSAFFIARHREQDRNFYVYSTFGLLLVLAAGTLLLAGIPRLLLWALLGVAFTGLGKEAGRVSLKWHGAIYLGTALFVAGLIGQGAARFLGSAHAVASWPDAAAWIGMSAIVGSYLLLLRGPAAEPASVSYRALSAILCLGAAWSLSAVAARLLTRLCSGSISGSADYCPTILTAILVVLAISLAAAARRSDRIEQVWVAWAFLALATCKLLLQDFRQSQNLALVLSLLLYGGTLVLLPRMLQKTRRTSPGDHEVHPLAS